MKGKLFLVLDFARIVQGEKILLPPSFLLRLYFD
jgi:hypothetical protein